MGTLSKPYTFTAATDAVAAQVNANFDTLFNWVDGGSAMWADGSVAFSGIPLSPNTDPTNQNHLTRKRYVDAKVVAGPAISGPTPSPATPVNAYIQTGWGTVTTDGSGNVTIPFGKAWSTSLFFVHPHVDDTLATHNGWHAQYFNGTLTTFGIHITNAAGGAATSAIVPINWMAIGY